MLSKLIIIVSTILSPVLMQANSTQTDLTIGQLCSNTLLQMKVEHGFRVGTYICLIGKVNHTSVDTFGPRTVIRFTPSLNDSNLFREPWIWNEFKYATEKGIDYIITTDDLSPLFKNQTSNELLFYVRNQSTVFAFTVDYWSNYWVNNSISVPTFTIGQHRKVQDSNHDYDTSGEISISFLLKHFPDSRYDKPRFVQSVMLYNRNVGDDGFPRVFALVYTRHVFDGQPVYMRHFMKSERHKVKDYRGPEYDSYYLSWYFDPANQFCQTVANLPLSVVHFRTDETIVPGGRSFARQISVKFLEFFPLYHQRMHLLYPHYRNDTFTIETLESNIPNSFICASPPSGNRSLPWAVPCAGCIREIVWVEDKARWINIFESEQYSRNFTFAIALIVLTVILIFVVFIIGIILILKRIYGKSTTNTTNSL